VIVLVFHLILCFISLSVLASLVFQFFLEVMSAEQLLREMPYYDVTTFDLINELCRTSQQIHADTYLNSIFLIALFQLLNPIY